MRYAVLLVFILALSAPASAQKIEVACTSAPAVGRVDVAIVDGETIRGTLFCLTADDVSLLRDGQVVTTPLSKVKRISRPADPAWDGAAKGGGIVLTMWGVICGFCGADSSGPWRAVAAYAAIGGIVDALQTNRKTFYVGPRASVMKLRVSF